MTSRRVRAQALVKWVVVLACAAAGAAQAGDREDRQRPDRPQLHSVRDDSGVLVTISTNGFIDERNPFFRPLGSNGRSCVTCHQPQEGWTMTPKGLRQRFDETQGTDPVFRLVDGADSPLADVSTRRAREKAYSMLLDKGVIRIGLAVPADGRVRARRRRRSVPLREREGAVPVPAPARLDQPALPEHGDVGRPRDAARRFAAVPVQHADVLRDDAGRSRRPGELGHARPRAGHGAAHRCAAPGDRRLRDGPVHGAAARRPGRTAHRRRRERRADVPVDRAVVFRHQRHAVRRLPDQRSASPRIR